MPLVWYAAYGSNLLRERFVTYLRGGPVPGSGRQQRGARDPSDPLDARPFRLSQTLVFGQRSAGWGGGGVCFVDAVNAVDLVDAVDAVDADRVEPEATLGRAWLITVEQAADVWAQENGKTEAPEIDLERLEADGETDFGRPGWYRRLLHLGELEDRPVVTFTCRDLPALNAAGGAYLEVVGRGLIETWDLDPAQTAAYLASRPGNQGQVDTARLAASLAVVGSGDS